MTWKLILKLKKKLNIQELSKIENKLLHMN